MQAALSPWIPRSKSDSRRDSSTSMGLALPSPSVFADMIFDDDSDDDSAENNSSARKSLPSSSQATPAHSRSRRSHNHAATGRETPAYQPSPLVLRPVDRNHYDGYIRRAQQQQRKARNEFKRSMTTKVRAKKMRRSLLPPLCAVCI